MYIAFKLQHKGNSVEVPGAVPGFFINIDMTTPIKKDQSKHDWSLIPFDALEEVVEVLEFGKQKYASYNWAEGSGFNYSRVANAALRHLFAWIRGEDLDPETNKSHLAHCCCNILFLLYYLKYKDRYCNDDRYKR